MNEAKLECDQYVLAIEKSGHDQELAKFEAFTKQAELKAAEQAIQRRVIVAPFDGVVEEIKRHQEEWVQPGDTILNLLRLDTMHVEGAVEQSKYDPQRNRKLRSHSRRRNGPRAQSNRSKAASSKSARSSAPTASTTFAPKSPTNKTKAPGSSATASPPR